MQRIDTAIQTENGGAAATAEHSYIRDMIPVERAALSGRSLGFEVAIAEEEGSPNAQSPNSPSRVSDQSCL
jgi:hypothetical protein